MRVTWSQVRKSVVVMALTAAAIATGGCEIVDRGDLVVTWRFNDQTVSSSTDDVCAVFNASGRLTPSGLARIEVTGPTHFVDFVVCDNRDVEYPLDFYKGMTDAPAYVYAVSLFDLPPGTYQVRLSFVDHDGRDLEQPAPVESSVKVRRGDRARLDVNVEVPFGRADVTWNFSGGLDCAGVGAKTAEVHVVGQGGGEDETRGFDCAAGSSDATPFTPLTPDTYHVSVRLLDASGGDLTGWKDAGSTMVEAGITAESVAVSFDATDVGLNH